MHNCDALPFVASLLPDPLALRDDRFADPERAFQGFRAVRDRKHAAETGGANNRRASRLPVATRPPDIRAKRSAEWYHGYCGHQREG